MCNRNNDQLEAEGIDQVTIADRNLDAAHQIATRLQGKEAKVDVKSMHANDHRSLVEAMQFWGIPYSL